MTDEHAALVTMRRMIAAILSRDWDAYADTVAEDSFAESRRLGVKSTRDRRASIEQARAIADIGLTDAEAEVLESRGEHAALLRLTGRANDFELHLLCVSIVDDAGRFLRSTYFDEDAEAEARAELDRLAAQESS